MTRLVVVLRNFVIENETVFEIDWMPVGGGRNDPLPDDLLDRARFPDFTLRHIYDSKPLTPPDRQHARRTTTTF